jgi:mannose/cellobiose epimerase-like protein (N-acyl-D-glucosamine 2-epimerase family)
VHQFNLSQSETQRPLCCAQAPDIFALVAFACFAAMAGDADAAARTAAIVILTTHFMDASPKLRSQKELARIVLSGQGAHRF